MKSDVSYIADILFKNKILSISGYAFEDFFTSIMQKYDNRFLQIKPQGSLGDRKNDGFIKEEGIYYQVYSPENPEKTGNANGAKKALEDFEGLYKYWNDKCKIRTFNFVFNDRNKGVYPDIAMALLNLEKKYPDVKFKLFLVSDLCSLFMILNDEAKYSLVGYIPEVDDLILDYDALSQVVIGLTHGTTPKLGEKLVVPDFDKKIVFNGLTEVVKRILTVGGYQIGSLEYYFSNNLNKSYRSCIKDILQSYYDVGKQNGYFGDSLFMYIVDQCAIKIGNKDTITMAIYILMAYYFESCDIFEEPK